MEKLLEPQGEAIILDCTSCAEEVERTEEEIENILLSYLTSETPVNKICLNKMNRQGFKIRSTLPWSSKTLCEGEREKMRATVKERIKLRERATARAIDRETEREEATARDEGVETLGKRVRERDRP